MRLGRVSQPPLCEPLGGWNLPCLSAQQCSPGIRKQQVKKRLGPREMSVFIAGRAQLTGFFHWLLLIRAVGYPCTRTSTQTGRHMCADPVHTSLHGGVISL